MAIKFPGELAPPQRPEDAVPVSAAISTVGGVEKFGSLDGSVVEDDTITAGKVTVSNLSSISADLGSITAGTITGGTISGGTVTGATIKTKSTGARVELTADDDRLLIYDAGNDLSFSIDDVSDDIEMEAADGRDLVMKAAGNVAVANSGGLRFDTTTSSAQGYDWGIAAYVSGGDYGWVSEMTGGTWKFDMTAGTP